MVKILPPFFHLALLAQAEAKDLCLSSIHVIDDFLHDGEASTLLKKVQMSEPLVEASVEERLRETLDVPPDAGLEGSVIPARSATGNVSEHQDLGAG